MKVELHSKSWEHFSLSASLAPIHALRPCRGLLTSNSPARERLRVLLPPLLLKLKRRSRRKKEVIRPRKRPLPRVPKLKLRLMPSRTPRRPLPRLMDPRPRMASQSLLLPLLMVSRGETGDVVAVVTEVDAVVATETTEAAREVTVEVAVEGTNSTTLSKRLVVRDRSKEVEEVEVIEVTGEAEEDVEEEIGMDSAVADLKLPSLRLLESSQLQLQQLNKSNSESILNMSDL